MSRTKQVSRAGVYSTAAQIASRAFSSAFTQMLEAAPPNGRVSTVVRNYLSTMRGVLNVYHRSWQGTERAQGRFRERARKRMRAA